MPPPHHRTCYTVSESLEATKFMGFMLTDQSAGFLEIDSFTKIGFIVVLKTGLRQASGFKLIIGCTDVPHGRLIKLCVVWSTTPCILSVRNWFPGLFIFFVALPYPYSYFVVLCSCHNNLNNINNYCLFSWSAVTSNSCQYACAVLSSCLHQAVSASSLLLASQSIAPCVS